MLIDIQRIILILQQRRKVFVSEADFQLEFAWVLKEQYPDKQVRLEFCPEFLPQMHIDIVLFDNGKWVPIELKYKTKKFTYTTNGEKFRLKNQSAKDNGCYMYLKDIARIEQLKNELGKSFAEGYTVFITNEPSYKRAPSKENCFYQAFSLDDGRGYVHGKMEWSPETSAGTRLGNEQPIILEGEYPIRWQEYSKIDETSAGTFYYLCNTIKG